MGQDVGESGTPGSLSLVFPSRKLPEVVMDLTPTQDRIYKLLSDGMPHSTAEVKACFDDELTDNNAVGQMVFRLRRALARSGYGVMCEQVNGSGSHYRLVRFIQK